jgi:hypothetical protein
MVERIASAHDRLIDREKRPYYLGKFCSVEIQASEVFRKQCGVTLELRCGATYHLRDAMRLILVDLKRQKQ